MDIKILSCFHKQFNKPNSDIIYPIHVGKEISNIDLKILVDNKGDNISKKNPNYCELTAIYWAWKNIECDIIGLTHYRRYFDFRKGLLKYNVINVESEDILYSSIFEKYEQNILNILSGNYDIIVPKKIKFQLSVRNQYLLGHIKEDIQILEEVIQKIYPEYMQAYNDIFNKSNKVHLFNMFIMKKEQLNEYCEWLFNILFEVEKRIKISEYPHQARVFGFMSERLLNVYIKYNKLRVKELPIILIDNNLEKNNIIKTHLQNLRSDIKFRI